jgi:hypothetical protein
MVTPLRLLAFTSLTKELKSSNIFLYKTPFKPVALKRCSVSKNTTKLLLHDPSVDKSEEYFIPAYNTKPSSIWLSVSLNPSSV